MILYYTVTLIFYIKIITELRLKTASSERRVRGVACDIMNPAPYGAHTQRRHADNVDVLIADQAQKRAPCYTCVRGASKLTQ